MKRYLLTIAVIFAASAGQAQEAAGGLYKCVITKATDYSGANDVGEKFFLGAASFLKRINLLYQNGVGPDLKCDVTGAVYICNHPSLNRNVVFDSGTGKLIQPFNFEDDFSESQCEPYTIE